MCGLFFVELVVFCVVDEYFDIVVFSVCYGFGLEDCVNILVLCYKCDGVEGYVVVVNLGLWWFDVNGVVKVLFGVCWLFFVVCEVVIELIGM